MWVIRAYDRQTGELVHENELGKATPRRLERMLGFAPTKLGSTPLDQMGLGKLAAAFGLAVDKRLDHFLDFDADLHRVPRGRKPKAAAVS
jgi:hypothetical protein